MEGYYIPINDGSGTVGYIYVCPKCKHKTHFTNCEDGCEKCKHSEPYVCGDDWYDEEIKKPKEMRAWNVL